MRSALAGLLTTAVVVAMPHAAPRAVPRGLVAPVTVELTGTLSRVDRLRWIDVPFDVPAGTTHLEVEFEHSDREAGTAIEVGLVDPERARGNSRTSKRRFHLAVSSATPSYLAGPLPPGRWHLRLGVASIRDGVVSTWRARLRCSDEEAAWSTTSPPGAADLPSGPRWYRGDFHTHTGHSDGFGCDAGNGGRRACTVFDVAAAAAGRGLDFVAVTDHNVTSHHAEIALVQGAFPNLLLVRGQEMTSFQGHANVYGTSQILDFRLGETGADATAVFTPARARGALVSINHPRRETGERCTGCGWTAVTNYAQVDAIEVVNGQVVEGATAGLTFWRARLDEGARLVAIAGSDDHTGGRDGKGVGTPTTVVFADSLTEGGLLAGVRRGRVHIRTRGADGPSIDMTAWREGAPSAPPAFMGDSLKVDPGGTPVRLSVEVAEGAQQMLEVWRDRQPQPVERRQVEGARAIVNLTVVLRPGGWAHVVLRDASGITAIGNPVFAR